MLGLCIDHPDHGNGHKGSDTAFDSTSNKCEGGGPDSTKEVGKPLSTSRDDTASKLKLLSVALGRLQGLGVLVTKLFPHTLMSCTATGFVQGTLLPGPSPLASNSSNSNDSRHRYLT